MGSPRNGDVWKAVVLLRTRPSIDVAVGNFDYGCGVVLRRPNSSPLQIDRSLETLVYADLDTDRKEWLRLLAPSELLDFMASNPPSPPAGTPADSPRGRPPLPDRPPRRDELDGPDVRWLKRGGPTKADLKIIERDSAAIVVKDFRHKAAWVRLVGRLQIGRECGAYQWLGTMDGLPRFVGRVDRHALAVEWIQGSELAFRPDRREGGP